MRMLPTAQQTAPARPRSLLNWLVCMFQGWMMSANPPRAQIAASHCGRRMRSPRNGQAINNIQNGMV